VTTLGNIDYDLAKNEIESKFKEFEHRICIFWYDETQSFLEEIKNDSFDNVKTIIYDKNEFAIKHQIEVEDLESNFLIYFPCPRPQDKDNWLLDTLLYSVEYYADQVALTMRKLGLSNPYLRKVVDKYAKFFKSEARIGDLRKQVTINDQVAETDLLNGMIAVLVKAKSLKTEALLTELIFDVESGTKYQDIFNFGLEDYLWNQINAFTNYSGEQSIFALVKQYMMTALAKTSKMENYSSFYKQYIIDSSKQASNDALLLVDNLKHDNRYNRLQDYIANSLRIEELIRTRGIDDLGNSDVFEVFDTFIIKSILESLSGGSLDYDFFENIVKNNRINSYWYQAHQKAYDAILEIIHFNKSLNIKIYDNFSSEEYIKLYKDSLYKIDLHYRHVINLLNQISTYEDSIEALKSKIIHQYEMHLDHLGSYFSKSIEKKNEWSFIGEKPLQLFYADIQRITYKKMFVIISDALRFEVASELYDNIQADPVLKGKSELLNLIAPVPSITKVGMASLLPNKNIQYGTDVLVDGLSTISTDSRSKILFTRNKTFSAIRYEDISSMNRSDIREYMKDKSLVYVYHNTIDTAGEHQENKVFSAASDAIDEILTLIRKLYNSLQISNFIVTADHGFLYRELKVDDSLKYNDVSKLKPIELSRRYAIVNDDTTVPYTLKFKLDYLGENNQSVIMPYSYDYFKSPGGIQYVHGGASLQEIIVPYLRISELRSGALKQNIGPVGVRIKSINRTITQRSFTIDFEQYEKVVDKKTERKLITYFIDDQGNDVSGRYAFVASSDSDDLNQRITRIRFTLNNIDFNRDRRYMLILKDENQGENEYLEKEVFKIDILGFKTIF
jgi:uncharacterized protein (TIGR02687 family)